MSSARLDRLLAFSLGLWVLGVQLQETLATVGAWLTVALVLVAVWPERRQVAWRTWVPLFSFVGVALLLPLLGGARPTGTGVARLSDFLLIPAGAVAMRRLSAEALGRVAKVGVTVLLVSCAAAGLQHSGVWPKNEFFEPLRWTRIAFERVYETVPGRTDRFMGCGLLFHRLKFANVSAVMVLLATVGLRLRVGPRGWLLAAVSLGTLSLALFPHARAALVALAAAMAVVWVVGAQERARAVGVTALALALLLGLVLATPSLRARFASSLTAEGSGERTGLTSAGLEAIAQHPLTGVGAGRFHPRDFAGPDAPEQVRQHPGKAHNQFVTLGAEGGLLTVLALLFWLGRLGWAGARTLPSGLLAVGAVTLFGALSMLHDPLFHVESSMALMLLFGAAFASTQGSTSRPP